MTTAIPCGEVPNSIQVADALPESIGADEVRTWALGPASVSLVATGATTAMRFVVGNLTMQVNGLTPSLAAVWRKEFAPFLSTQSPDLMVAYEGGVSLARRQGEASRIREGGAGNECTLVRRSGWCARLDIAVGDVEVCAAGDWPQEVRVLLSPAAQARAVWLGRAVPLHGAAFVLDGEAVALIGGSGAGKSTCARQALARGCDLLAEELVWVGGLENGRPRVHMLPFAEKHRLVEPRLLTAPLAGIFVLEQSIENVVVDLGPAERLRALWQRTSVGFRVIEVVTRGFRLGSTLEALLPVKRLRFTRGDAFVDVIAEWLHTEVSERSVESVSHGNRDDGRTHG